MKLEMPVCKAWRGDMPASKRKREWAADVQTAELKAVWAVVIVQIGQ